MRQIVCIVLFLIAAGSAPGRAAPDFAKLNIALADGVVIPAYRAFAARTQTLSEATTAWCVAPSPERQAATRAAFREAMLAWQRARPVIFGPVAANSRTLRIQFWPDRRGTGERHLRRALAAADPALVAPGGLAGQSVALQGLGTFEQLFHDHGGNAYACSLAAAIARFQHDTARQIVAEWTAPDGFRAWLVPPAGGNASYASAKDAATDFIKSLSTMLDIVIDQKLEAPLGRIFAEAAPRRAESWRSGLSLDNIAANIEVLADWFAVPGGFRDQLGQAGAEALGIGMEKTFRAVALLARGISVPLAQAVADQDHRPQVKALLEEVRNLRLLVREAVASELGLSVGFNSLDGD